MKRLINGLFVVAMGVGSPALAQNVDTSTYLPRGSRSEGSVTLPSARLLPTGTWEFSLGLGHDGEVARVTSQTGDVRGTPQTATERWINQRDMMSLQLAFSPMSGLELLGSLPLLLGQSTETALSMEGPDSAGSALGDAHLGARLALLRPQAWNVRGLQWVAQAGVSLPSGRAETAFSEHDARMNLGSTLEWQSGQAWSVGGHAGYQMGAPQQIGDQLFGDRVIVGGAFTYRWRKFQFNGDALSLINVGEATPQTDPLRASFELLGGARYFRGRYFTDLGAGVAPLDDGLTPRWRVLVSVGVIGRKARPAPAPIDPDPDRDGVLGDADQCPSRQEDLDGFEDSDGCPEIDDDGDGIVDSRDACPREAEDVDKVEDADGCPEVDADGDAVLDAQDRCPLAAEDFDGFEDDDGCPEAGSLDGRQAFRNKLLTERAIFFDVGRATLDKVGLSTAREVAALLLQGDEAVEVVGHADEQGAEGLNDALALERATAVQALLVEAGIPAERLRVRSAGQREPLTKAVGFGRSLNRSVTFNRVAE